MISPDAKGDAVLTQAIEDVRLIGKRLDAVRVQLDAAKEAIRQYRAVATHSAMFRLIDAMPAATFADVCRAAYARGESVEAYVGRIAFKADRGQDVELVEGGGE